MENKEKKRPLLSICIPIYNRGKYLHRMLMRFCEDKDLFENKIELIIADNCSEDDLLSIVKTYREKGLNISYNRHETNIGPDKNFEYCFKVAAGKYCWLLGSDDIPSIGVVREIIKRLDGADLGLLHVSGTNKKSITYVEYNDNNKILVDINVFITFMSANIINTSNLANLDLSEYRKSNLIQVVAYMDACLCMQKNAILYIPSVFEEDRDTKNNGGYNLFGVFVGNLYWICQTFVDSGKLSVKAFEQWKKKQFKDFLSLNIVQYLILREKNFYDLTGSMKLLYKYYGHCLYAYYYVIRKLIRRPFGVLRDKFQN